MLKLKIVSPERVVFSGDVERVTVPGTAGEFEILVNHAPIISSLERGTVTYQSEGGLQSLQVQGGFVSVKKNEVNVCVEV
jgi:F-type H+-transporting ATPase subunit epsilon